ncbi:transglycosylase-like protein [Frankia sp. EI5c]|uniref:transglycosylase family protein n=1 Tax=Frankia sp. EI5c TaxID=683316 RepID=UPI0007C3CCE6|nr:transglycosylase family protein [Frankia sp. EI5c]OAA20684.1 transglycosylase-like protein [Frankia sp. EI5c]
MRSHDRDPVRSTGRGGRHRAATPPSTATRVLRTTGAVTALVGTGLAITAVPAGAATADDFARLRKCESGGNYAINTGNGFYGAYQFDQRTWTGLGYPGRPDQAPPAMQDEAAYKLYDQRGWSPWPGCTSKLGLTRNGPAPTSSGAGGDVIEQALTPAEEPMTLERARSQVGSSFGGEALNASMGEQVRADAFVWQAKMRERRFVLTVDGKFGRESQGVAALYSYLTRVSDGQPGVVGQNLWSATVAS